VPLASRRSARRRAHPPDKHGTVTPSCNGLALCKIHHAVRHNILGSDRSRRRDPSDILESATDRCCAMASKTFTARRSRAPASRQTIRPRPTRRTLRTVSARLARRVTARRASGSHSVRVSSLRSVGVVAAIGVIVERAPDDSEHREVTTALGVAVGASQSSSRGGEQTAAFEQQFVARYREIVGLYRYGGAGSCWSSRIRRRARTTGVLRLLRTV